MPPKKAVEATTSAQIFHLGVRHHGPGSARAVREALEQLKPTLLLIEGPPDADQLLESLRLDGVVPPVALLIFVKGDPRRAAFFPFAHFSPEWQAIQWAKRAGCRVQFMDLPQSFQLAISDAQNEPISDPDFLPESDGLPAQAPASNPITELTRRDPISALAHAAGEADGEQWWERMIEQRQDIQGMFTAIDEAMTALREGITLTRREMQREAHMRTCIRSGIVSGAERIAIVCGAWHVPALKILDDPRGDEKILRGLPRVKTSATWVPWTHSRLSRESGYGAGILAPGWDAFLFDQPVSTSEAWLTRVARLLRETDLEISPAHVLEAVRLAEALASIRGLPRPGLTELNDAALAVFCSGEGDRLEWIRHQLVVGEVMGSVPDTQETAPLRLDVHRHIRSLRLKYQDELLELDLRETTDRARSRFLHRLELLGVEFGKKKPSQRRLGSFAEEWTLDWKPTLELLLIDRSVFGNSLEQAVIAWMLELLPQLETLDALLSRLELVLFAELQPVLDAFLVQLQTLAALSHDVTQLLQALPPLARMLRYGNVRQTEGLPVAKLVDGLVARISASLVPACLGLDEEASRKHLEGIQAADQAIRLVDSAELLETWLELLEGLAEGASVHPILRGHATRILLDSKRIDSEEAGRRLALEVSPQVTPALASAWVDGFLQGSGLLLIHDPLLWSLLDQWVKSLAPAAFVEVLPLLRRTFSRFSSGERRRMGERARTDEQKADPFALPWDLETGLAVFPTLLGLLGNASAPDNTGGQR